MANGGDGLREGPSPTISASGACGAPARPTANGPIADDALCFSVPSFDAIEPPADADLRADDARREPGHRSRRVTATATGIACDEFNATIYEEAIADALGTEDADYSDAACSDAGRRRLADGEDDTVEIYSEVTIPGRAVPSGFNAQRYLMKQLQPERFQTRIHRTAARRGVRVVTEPGGPGEPLFQHDAAGGRPRGHAHRQRRLMGDLTIIEAASTSTFAPTAAMVLSPPPPPRRTTTTTRASTRRRAAPSARAAPSSRSSPWPSGTRRRAAAARSSRPRSRSRTSRRSPSKTPWSRAAVRAERPGAPRQSGPQPAVAACDFPDPESDRGVCGAI